MNQPKFDPYWFLQSPEEIDKMIDALPPPEYPDGEKLLAAITAAQNDAPRLLQVMIDYIKLGLSFEQALEAAKKDV